MTLTVQDAVTSIAIGAQSAGVSVQAPRNLFAATVAGGVSKGDRLAIVLSNFSCSDAAAVTPTS